MAFGVLDAWLKLLAQKDTLPNINAGIVNFSSFQNPGIAFSIPLPQQWTLAITGGLIIFFTVLFVLAKKNTIKIALFAALVGSGSNFIDRLITGFTTDYIILFSRSAVNIADVLILAGIGYCAWYYQRTDKETGR